MRRWQAMIDRTKRTLRKRMQGEVIDIKAITAAPRGTIIPRRKCQLNNSLALYLSGQ